MNHHKLLLILLLSLFCSGLYAQDTLQVHKCPDYDVRFKKLKELHKPYYKVEAYQTYRKLYDIFLEKLNHGATFEKIPNDVMHYIIANIDKTTFSSYESAEMEWLALTAASKTAAAESIPLIQEVIDEYVAYSKECIEKCGPQIFINVFNETNVDYREFLNNQP